MQLLNNNPAIKTLFGGLITPNNPVLRSYDKFCTPLLAASKEVLSYKEQLELCKHDLSHLSLAGIIGIHAPFNVYGEAIANTMEATLMAKFLGVVSNPTKLLKLLQLGQFWESSYLQKQLSSTPPRQLSTHLTYAQQAIATPTLSKIGHVLLTYINQLEDHLAQRQKPLFFYPNTYTPIEQTLQAFAHSPKALNQHTEAELAELYKGFGTVRKAMMWQGINYRLLNFNTLPELAKLSPKEKFHQFTKATGLEAKPSQLLRNTWVNPVWHQRLQQNKALEIPAPLLVHYQQEYHATLPTTSKYATNFSVTA